jgi:geranylgeranyl diphosphate synthase, type II
MPPGSRKKLRALAIQCGKINSTMTLREEEFEQALERSAKMVEEAIDGYLVHDSGVPVTLSESMTYSLHAGGKCLRPVMSLWACKAVGGDPLLALPAAAAIELIHTYSLIHDDLPAMDDDDMRRGKPTNHKVFGEGVAVLTGDALLTYAFHILARHVQQAELVRPLILDLSTAAGASGMIGGQITDLLSENFKTNPISDLSPLEAVNYVHAHKTAMLFQAAARMGGICVDAPERQLDALADYGIKFGLAYQITDDLLDITSTAESMGKRTQKDEKAGKLTYPAVVGEEKSQQKAVSLIEEAIADLADLGEAAEPLRHLARMVINRKS